jgi:hypothetical protein
MSPRNCHRACREHSEKLWRRWIGDESGGNGMGDESFPPSPAADQKGTRPTHFAAVLAPPCSLRFSLWAAKIIFRHSLIARPARSSPTERAVLDSRPRRACEHPVNFPAITLNKNGAVCRGYYCDVRGKRSRAREMMFAGLHLRASLGFWRDKSTMHTFY